MSLSAAGFAEPRNHIPQWGNLHTCPMSGDKEKVFSLHAVTISAKSSDRGYDFNQELELAMLGPALHWNRLRCNQWSRAQINSPPN